MGHYAKRMELMKKDFLTYTESRLLEAFRFEFLVSESLVSASKGEYTEERLFVNIQELLEGEFADTFYTISEIVAFIPSVNLSDMDRLLIDYSTFANTSASLARLVLAGEKDGYDALHELRDLLNDL